MRVKFGMKVSLPSAKGEGEYFWLIDQEVDVTGAGFQGLCDADPGLGYVLLFQGFGVFGSEVGNLRYLYAFTLQRK